MGNDSGSHDHDRAGTTVADAAQRLGITEGAVRKRVERGKLSADRGPDGRLIVYLDSDTTATDTTRDRTRPSREADTADQPLVDELRDRVSYLQRQVEEEREARRRADTLLARLMDRVGPLELEAASGSDAGEDALPSEAAGAPAKSSTRTVAEGVSVTVISTAIIAATVAAVKVMVPLVVAIAALVVAGVAALNGQFYAALVSGVTSLAATLLGYLIFRWQAKRESQRAWNDIAQEALGFDVGEVSVRPPSDTPGSPEADADEPGGGSGPSR